MFDVNIFTVVGAIVAVAATIIVLLSLGKPWHPKIPLVKGSLPFFGQMFIMLKGSPWDTMANWALEYGKIYRIVLFGSEAIVVSDPELLKVVLQHKTSVFKKDTEWTYHPFMVILGGGIVTSEGESWKRQRLLLSSHLKTKILDSIPDMAFRAVQRLSVKLDKVKASGEIIEMAEEFRHLTLQVIAEAILSLSPEESDSTFAHMYLPIVTEGNLRTWNPEREYILTPSWFKFRKDVEKLNNYVAGLIEKRWALRKQEGEQTNRSMDVLDIVLKAVADEGRLWNADTIAQVRDEVKTFILAGHETSASMLSWSLYELTNGKNNEALSQVRNAAAIVFKEGFDKKTRKVTRLPSTNADGRHDKLDGLEYADCCLRESLRKYSVVPTVVRKCSESVDMGEYNIQAGSTIMVCLQGVHHNPQYWPEPMKYDPSRFLEREKIQPYTFVPFIEGGRMCLGQFLSLLESKVVLSMLLSQYDFELINHDTAGEKHPFMVPIIPKTGHYMKVR